MQFSLNANLNTDTLSNEFKLDKRVQVPQIVQDQQLNALFKCMHNELSYDQALIMNNQAQLMPLSTFKSLEQAEAKQLVKNVYEQAARGVGFWYGRAPESEKTKPLLIEFKKWLNSNEVFNFVKKITGEQEICNTVIQYTRYLPGDFLTRHKDLGSENTRKIAFVFHLSPQWHPDWGGLLQFYQQDGQPRDAWAPNFGSLHLFNTQHIHAVTAITSFAPSARYTISGWFTTK